MDKQELVKQISVSMMRLGLFFNEETKSFLWLLKEKELELILKFLGYCQRFYRRGK